MSNWAVIFPDLEPEAVVGEPEAYDNAHQQAGQLATAADGVETEFANLTGGGNFSEVQGEAADALGRLVKEVDGSLDELSPVFTEIDGVFAKHLEQLRGLRKKAADALGRAETRWNQQKQAVASLEAAEAHLERVRCEVRCHVPDPDDPATDDCLQRRLDNAEEDVADKQCELHCANEELEESRGEYHDLCECEQELVDETVECIKGIDLGDLKDPSRLEQLAGDLVDWVTDFAKDLLDAILDGLEDIFEALVDLAKAALTELLRAVAIVLKAILLTLAHIVQAILTLVINHPEVLIVLLAVLAPPMLNLLVVPVVVKLLAGGGRKPPDQNGDPGDTYSCRVPGNNDWELGEGSNSDIGRAVTIETLNHTADNDRIWQDEFEIIVTGAPPNEKYIVVLPGVTDLTKPYVGYNPNTNTGRDVDQVALYSSASTGMDDNLYAQMVNEALRRRGVPLGADVMLVGHSQGGDTVLDLAADPRFNGPGAYHVTHVLAAAYDSEPQLASIPDSTNVLVTQNNKDVPVIVEGIGYPFVSGTDSFMKGLDSFIDRDVAAGIAGTTSGVGSVAGGVKDILSNANLGGSDVYVLPDQMVPRSVRPGPNQAQIVFDGDFEGAGHHQNNYTDYLGSTNDPNAVDFFESVGRAGYGERGSSVSIDVSVPEDGVVSQ